MGWRSVSVSVVPFGFQAAYEDLNATDDDYRFYAALAHELRAHQVLDLGCGTGVLACLLAAAGHTVMAIDPDPEMLRVARAKSGAEQVDWRLGFSDAADSSSADLAIMSGHVAQVFDEDQDWQEVLAQLHRALHPGGTLSFETRNPQARGWEAWTREQSLQTLKTAAGRVEFWHETIDVDLPHVTYDTFSRNLDSGQEERTRNRLAFRDEAALTSSLRDARYEVVAMHGSWDRGPLIDSSPEIIVVARRR